MNLARILLEKKKHAVLFLDADITGTNAVEFLDSPFWKGTCYGVQNGKSKPKDHVNLLELFERSFMTGKSLPSFFKKKKKKDGQPYDNSLLLILDKINIIGSHIYNDDLNGSPKKGNDKKDSDNLICRPSILFDELHSFWFIEFLHNLCKDFLETIRQYEEDRPVAVIIDNSPGYVGITPAVQEWLTDIGPDKGKFLIVSSLDIQDLSSCGHAINNLRRLYERKWETRRKFVNAISKSSKEFQLTPEEERFFCRLVESYPRRCKISDNPDGDMDRINGTELPFYLNDDDKTGKKYFDQPDKYQGLLINRVPRLANWGEYDYNTKCINALCKNNKNKQQCEYIKWLLGEKRGSYFDCMVTYEESIEYQFLQTIISQKTDDTVSQNKKQFKHTIETSHSVLFDIDNQNMQLRRKTQGDQMFQIINERRDYLQKVHGKVKDVISLAEEYGYSHLTRLIHEEWLPIKIMGEFPSGTRRHI